MFFTPVILLPINNNNRMKIMLILTLYALLARGEGPGMKRNRKSRYYAQFL